ncbi:hypothetical protein B9N43_01890 [Denitratisoma sp. DHT3]|uniref:iron-sulfur cluster assembly scaffold protein n=1 Tax=Denitratisoma sp. DHT3 TaxID=1981880 RepID=UPI0011985BA1|nr:iron-sulfur cluster assembly scaffold protein [Denitratisoma sp. DHT3]QDX80114.1 hypothetical protein B9N43_01890 [Denitratisoma sp. DHT3]
MSAALYHEALKALAQAAHGAGRLEAADVSLRLDNPLCGDRIDLHLRWDGDRIVALAHETKGCLLCRASASILGLRAPGCGVEDIRRAAAELDALLAGGTEKPSWIELEVFTPVAAHPSRHGCVTLPWRALSQLLSAAAPN